jgi:hypothetical protein
VIPYTGLEKRSIKLISLQVLETLLSSHGMEPSACKSDLYTLAGIDSNHPTKLRSSIWRTHEVIEGGAEGIKVSHVKLLAKLRVGVAEHI